MPDIPVEELPQDRYRSRREHPPSKPPTWLMVCLGFCLALVALWSLPQGRPAQAAKASPPQPTPAAAATPTPTPEPTPTPTPEPTPTPTPDYSVPVPRGETVEGEDWFADAVFIGDSRTDGFKLFSGVSKQATFLDYTGLTVFDVMENKAVIRDGEEKISILQALEKAQYGKVYIALGVNELGYWNPNRFADTYAAFVDAVRERQSQATLYIQAIIPVNTALCKANKQPYYVTNEAIAAFNEALTAMAAEKEICLLRVDEPFLDENGETAAHLSADGVHFTKEGYRLWLDYLLTHTQPAHVGDPLPEPTATPAPTAAPAVTATPPDSPPPEAPLPTPTPGPLPTPAVATPTPAEPPLEDPEEPVLPPGADLTSPSPADSPVPPVGGEEAPKAEYQEE